MPETESEPVFVDVLTDEELSVVARPGAMPVMPFLDDLAEADRETARRSAYRSLVARGVVEPPTRRRSRPRPPFVTAASS